MKAKIIVVLIFTLLIATVFPTSGTINNRIIGSFTQPPIQWETTYGWPDTGYSYFVQQTNDGGYIATGVIYTTGGTNAEVFLVKTDANGNSQWTQTYGTPGYDIGYCVQQTTDGGYIIAGMYSGHSLWLIKTDANGIQQWNNFFSSLMLDTAYSVVQTTDGGYAIVGGYTYAPGPPDMWIIKTDSNGNKQWERKVGGGSAEYGHCIRQTTDGGYIIVGYTDSFGAGQEDAELVKLDNGGNILWIKYYGGNNDDRGNSVRQTSDGGYIISGYTKSFGAGQSDVYLIKTDGSGNLLWSQTYGGTNDDQGNSVRQTSDGGYIICGTTQSYGSGGVDVYLIKTDNVGTKQWDDTYGGLGNDDGQCADQTTDSYYIIAGTKFTTYNEFWLIKLGISTNQPPNKPTKPSGQTNGKIGTSYTYSSTAIDPDGDQIYYWFDWGDGTNSGWVGPYKSGLSGSASHTWTTQANYQIKAKAKDDPHGTVSVWSDPLLVNMPRSKFSTNNLLFSLYSYFANLFPILKILLQRPE